MKISSQTLESLTPLQRSYLIIEQLQSRLDASAKAQTEPIAVIGIGCRFPGGVDGPESFWKLLSSGVDAITEVPTDRWDLDQYYDPSPDVPGKMYTRFGGFIGQLKEMDADFFGISPKEAKSLDPQQRLLLEVSWEALEYAGLSSKEIAQTQTGVFVGICSNDYSRQLVSGGVEDIDAYLASGNAHSTASGRLSYFLGLTGPSLAVDTACSSSLVSLHLACSSLRNQECNLAIAGGVNRLISPEFSINFCKAHMLSKDGRCKTFDVKADGFVRGEGCGIVVLKRLSDAIADGDNILALIRGTAINQDGHTSGLTVPNGCSQQAVIRQALKNGGVDISEISYIEAHGTGTSLGDPIEIEALGKVFENSHSLERPLIVGSVKTNIGHLEGAAGIAGLIKVILQMQHKEIASHLHFEKPNPYINWSNLPISVPTESMAWQGVERRMAGVSSFGFSGTNAHVIVEEAPVTAKEKNTKKRDALESPYHLLTLSAKSEKALSTLVSQYLDHLNTDVDLDIKNICHTTNSGRSHFNHRVSIIASDSQQLISKLLQLKTDKEVRGLFKNLCTGNVRNPKIGFLFTGQGSQYIGMGRHLFETQPVFRYWIEECNQLLTPYLEQSLLDVLYAQPPLSNNTSLLDQTIYTQPALFAIEYALAQVWLSWGFQPSVVMGHSVGEYVAACIAGVFTLQEAIKLIALRATLMQSLPPSGKMLAIAADEHTVKNAILTKHNTVAIAAINGPQSIVISGVAHDVDDLRLQFEEHGIRTKELKVSHGFHSQLMDPIKDDFARITAQVTFCKPNIPIISNLTGKRDAQSIASSDYWVQHMREPVRFYDGLKALKEEACGAYLEIGPKPTLLGMLRQTLDTEDTLCLPSLREGMEDWEQMLTSLSLLYVNGFDIDWKRFHDGYERSKVLLPTYPFQRQRFWMDPSEDRIQNTSGAKELSVSKEDIECITHEIKKVGELSDTELELLPKLLELLARNNHQQPLKVVTLNSQDETPEVDETQPSLNPLSQKSNNDDEDLEILTAEPKARESLLRSYVSRLLMKVVGIYPSTLDWQKRLSELGIDSLMATDLRKAIERKLDLVVPVEYFAELSIEQFLIQILSLLNQKISQDDLKAKENEPTTSNSQDWFKISGQKSKASFRLFCLPYAGAGASTFYALLEKLAPEIEICPIQFPGRENRLKESPFKRIKPLVQSLTPLLEPYLDVPFAFLGYSLGGLISFELARELRRRKLPSPSFMFLCSCRAPQVPDLNLPIYTLPESRFIEELCSYKGIPENILKDSRLMQMYLPTLRADFEMLETYLYTKEDPFDFPLYTFGGLEDLKVTQNLMENWEKQTRSSFQLTMFEGDHFFFRQSEDQIINFIRSKVEALNKIYA